MFAKVFTQIFESTIAENYQVRHVFMDLLVMADSDGIIDKTPEAISRLTNVPLEEVTYALDELCKPDIRSRTKEFEGKRLIPLEEGRGWGWIIVNYDKYRAIRDEEARRIANRTYKQRQREKEKQRNVLDVSSNVSNVSTSQPKEREKEKKIKEEELERAVVVSYSSEQTASKTLANDKQLLDDKSPPENLHPLNYARKILEDLTLPVTPDNLRIVAFAIEAEIKSGKSGPAAYEFVLSGTKDARDEGYEITRFFFADAKYRNENRNRNGRGAIVGTQHYDTSGNRAVIEQMKREMKQK